MRASEVGFDTAKMGDEDLRIIIRRDNVAIAGGRPRGTLYGVYTFLEDYVGVRFLTPNHTHVPAIEAQHVLEEIDLVVTSVARYRALPILPIVTYICHFLCTTRGAPG
jgi:hypothetical protein